MGKVSPSVKITERSFKSDNMNFNIPNTFNCILHVVFFQHYNPVLFSLNDITEMPTSLPLFRPVTCISSLHKSIVIPNKKISTAEFTMMLLMNQLQSYRLTKAEFLQTEK